MENIKELDLYIKGKGETRGFNFKQIKFNGYAYIYEVDNDGDIYYEVFERRINQQFNTVSYPRSNSFGVWAFCLHTKEKAEDKYNELTYKVKNRGENAIENEEDIAED